MDKAEFMSHVENHIEAQRKSFIEFVKKATAQAMNEGIVDVLGKAIAICTECIGLG